MPATKSEHTTNPNSHHRQGSLQGQAPQLWQTPTAADGCTAPLKDLQREAEPSQERWHNRSHLPQHKADAWLVHVVLLKAR